MSSSRDIDVIAAASASGSVNVNVLDIRYPLPRSVIELMGTSVRRGTDKTGAAIARLEKSVDNSFRARQVGVDVVAILVISPGLEARRTRLAPRPPGRNGRTSVRKRPSSVPSGKGASVG